MTKKRSKGGKNSVVSTVSPSPVFISNQVTKKTPKAVTVQKYCPMDNDEIDTCKVCMEEYGEELRPRSLTCGHSFCTICIQKLLGKTHTFHCPKCNRVQSFWSATDLPVNYDLEEMIAKFRYSQQNTTKLADMTIPNTTIGHSKKMQGILKLQLDNGNDVLKNNEGVLCLVNEYQTLLAERKVLHRDLLPKLYDLASQNEDVVTSIDLEDERIRQIKAECEKLRHELSSSLASLHSNQEITSIAEVDNHCASLEKWSETYHHLVTTSENIDESNKLLSATMEAIKTFDYLITRGNSDLGPSNCEIGKLEQLPGNNSELGVTSSDSEKEKDETKEENARIDEKKEENARIDETKEENTRIDETKEENTRIDEIKEEYAKMDENVSAILQPTSERSGYPCLMINMRGDMSGIRKNLSENRKISAIQYRDGRYHYANLSVSDNKIYLHHLRSESPPSGAFVVKHGDLLKSLPSSDVNVFMDFECNGSVRGRISISLHGDTPLGRNFLMLCTGEMGPSYVNSKLLGVAFRKHPSNETVRFGDYECNNGFGGAPLIKNLKMNDPMYKRHLAPGVVWATYLEDGGPLSSQFSITTSGITKTPYNYDRVFGTVQEGLNILKYIVHVDDNSTVKIVDCGVILST